MYVLYAYTERERERCCSAIHVIAYALRKPKALAYAKTELKVTMPEELVFPCLHNHTSVFKQGVRSLMYILP